MVPTLTATLGVRGHRPVVGTQDNKYLLYVFAVVNVVTAAVHAGQPEGRQEEDRQEHKTRRMQVAFAAYLRRVGRVYPAGRHPRVVLVIDNAPWNRGKVIDEALAENPHLAYYRLPSYSPSLDPVERFWRKLRRRATHNRLFDAPADLNRSVLNSLCYFQTVRARVASLVKECYPAAPNPTESPNS